MIRPLSLLIFVFWTLPVWAAPRAVKPSPGCGKRSPAAGAQTIVSQGGKQAYLVSLPPGYDPARPQPLGFAFHGFQRTHVDCRDDDCPGFASVVAKQAVAVYMKSISAGWDTDLKRNTAYFSDVLARVKRDFCIDENRVFVAGTSSGAIFANHLGCKLGDFVSLLGWMSPMRTTAMAELRRGVTGDPAEWMAATGITPKSIGQTVGSRTANIQDKWFARLYLLKPLIIASLVLFWVASGFIALVISYDAATGILRSHNFPPALVAPITIVTSLMDMSIGALIAFRRTCAFGLVAGMVASLGYMLGSAILTPDLWIEPLGALVKTGPAIVLMLVALATLDNR